MLRPNFLSFRLLLALGYLPLFVLTPDPQLLQSPPEFSPANAADDDKPSTRANATKANILNIGGLPFLIGLVVISVPKVPI
jgi:hypothetical protein